MEDKLISVIVPVYNVERYLNRCVDSIINQTYKNLEIILIDDGSNDNSGKICDEYAIKDNRIKVIHKENGGVSSARNAGIFNSTGEYIGFVDSDDYIDCNFYEKMIFHCFNYMPDFVCCGMMYFNNGKLLSLEKTFYSRELIEKNIIPSLLGFNLKKDLNLLLSSVCNKIYKNEFIKNHKIIFDKNLSYAEDYAFNIICCKYSNLIYFVDDCKYNYFHNEESFSNSFRDNFFLNEINFRLFLENNFSNYDWESDAKIRNLKNLWEKSSRYYSNFLSGKKLKNKFSLLFDYYNKLKIYNLQAENEFESKLKRYSICEKKFVCYLFKYNKKIIIKSKIKRLWGRIKWKIN